MRYITPFTVAKIVFGAALAIGLFYAFTNGNVNHFNNGY